MKSFTQILQEARELIEKGELCRRALARDADGQQVPPWASCARCFCTSGAIFRITDGNWPFMPAIAVFERANGIDSKAGGVPRWHDSRATKDEVLAGFDAAIALAEKEAA